MVHQARRAGRVNESCPSSIFILLLFGIIFRGVHLLLDAVCRWLSSAAEDHRRNRVGTHFQGKWRDSPSQLETLTTWGFWSTSCALTCCDPWLSPGGAVHVIGGPRRQVQELILSVRDRRHLGEDAHASQVKGWNHGWCLTVVQWRPWAFHP